MKKLTSRIGAFTLLITLIAQGVHAAELGMPAPPLKIAEWVQGEPVDLSAGKGEKIYVVEFWATWCGPCRVSIPHLSELYNQFKDKDVVVIGVSDEPPATVKPFVKKMGDQMSYVVAADDNQQTSIAYMQAFGENGIPHAFVIDKSGKIVWHGHPMGGLEGVLAAVVAGTYDIEAAKKAERAQQKIVDYFDAASGPEYTQEAKDLGREIVQEGAADVRLLNILSWNILTHPAIQHRDLELALQAAKLAFDRTHGEDPDVLDTYARALFDNGKVEEAIQRQKMAVEKATDENMKAALQQNLEMFLSKQTAQ